MTDSLAVLQEFYRDKLSVLLGHIAGARLVTQYDANNAYQYIISREETQLSWVAQAVIGLGGDVASGGAEPDRLGSLKGPEAARRVMQEDATGAQAFVDRWQPRADLMVDTRHRGMMRVVLGETLEQKRFFEQALAGDSNLLGIRSVAVGARVGEVMPTRWIE